MARKLIVAMVVIVAALGVAVAWRYWASAGAAQEVPTTAGPRWVKEGMVITVHWEPIPFLLRRGGGRMDVIAQRAAQRTEEWVKFWKDAGMTLLGVTLFKGFGLQTEAEDIESTRKFVGLAHRHGLKVLGYVGASLMYETLSLEVPESRDWKQVDEEGRPAYYGSGGDQTFRYMACGNNPGYKAFIRKVLRLGIQDLKLDMVIFDQLRWEGEPRSCRCKYCQEEFRKFLRNKYADTQLKMRLGFARLDGIIPPPNLDGETRLTELRNPLMQEWADFRAANLARRRGELANYVHQLNPEAALLSNSPMAPSSNTGFTHGVDPSRLFQHGDVGWSEGPNLPEWTADGRLVSKIRPFKAVRTMGKTLVVWQSAKQPTEWKSRSERQTWEAPVELRLAEAMAYNDACLGSFRDPADMTPPARRYIDFFHAQKTALRDTEPVADVAILRSFASIEFNPSQSLFSTVLFEQSLIQGKIPFAIIYDRHLKELSKYKVLVLANQDALSDEQLQDIRAFVEKGGGLVATEETSLLTEWRRQRMKFGLADLFGLEEPPAKGSSPVRRPYGKGRVAYIPQIEAAVPAPRAQMHYTVANKYWKLPKNHSELLQSVKWAAGEELTAEVEAPEWVTMELARQRGTGLWLLHLVNYNTTKPVENIGVTVRMPAGMKLTEALVETPDGGGHQLLPVATQGQTVTFRVPRLKVYDLVLLRPDKS